MSAEPLFQPEHFRDVILARMEVLDLNNETVGDHDGPSTTKMTQIRKALPTPPRADIYRKLDQALRWKKGSARRVALGGEPVELPAWDDMESVAREIARSNLSPSVKREVLRTLELSTTDLEVGEGA